MKHIFIVQTADDVMIPISRIADIEASLEAAVENVIPLGRGTVAISICNVKSAIRAVYSHYGADHSQSPDQLGSARNGGLV